MSILYIYWNVGKQMTDVRLLLLHSNMYTHKPLNCVQQMNSARSKNVINKYVYKSYIFNIYL